ncbi:NTP transferase domain-containing protein [Streptomyces sp. F63]|uniref:nucleotidyltransferase family protein n=1 Tax=Streptomyces sp. F63 TaxID=2824887 RepID=UPI001B3807A7|nr:NTP transferase domain-containing protein [Streptomyces sp. F63]MBQ0987937.1 NTP transferase domain-containing protein [Streptomyces sp. F63]
MTEPTGTASGTEPAGAPADRPGPRVAGLLLAAGGGRRLGGRPKALLPHRGRPLVEYAARALRDGGCEPVHVVLGAAEEEVRARAELPGCVLVGNPRWEEGMGSSLRTGLTSLPAPTAPPGLRPRPVPAEPGARGTGPHEVARAAAHEVTAVIVALVDQPRVGAEAVARVRAACRSRTSLAAAAYGGRRGHPVLLGAAHWAAVAGRAAGDRGARTYLAEHRAALDLVDCSGIAAPDDIDTLDDLRLLDGDG